MTLHVLQSEQLNPVHRPVLTKELNVLGTRSDLPSGGKVGRDILCCVWWEQSFIPNHCQSKGIFRANPKGSNTLIKGIGYIGINKTTIFQIYRNTKQHGVFDYSSQATSRISPVWIPLDQQKGWSNKYGRLNLAGPSTFLLWVTFFCQTRRQW